MTDVTLFNLFDITAVQMCISTQDCVNFQICRASSVAKGLLVLIRTSSSSRLMTLGHAHHQRMRGTLSPTEQK